jgi:hypothetical protein
MPTLYGRAPKNSYPELLKLTNTDAGLGANLITVEDGTGVISPLSLSTTQIALNGLIWPTTTPGSGQVLGVGSGNQLVWQEADGSSVIPVLTYQNSLGTSNTVLATADQDVVLTQISLCNTTSSSQTVWLYIVPTSGSASAANAIFSAGLIESGQTVIIDTEMTVLNGASIMGYASAAGVTISLSGNGSSNIQQLYFGAVPTSATNVYTVTAGTMSLESIVVCNSSGSDQTLSVNLTSNGSPSSANAYLNNVTISANTTLLVDLTSVLPTNYTVNVVGSSANMSIMVTGF